MKTKTQIYEKLAAWLIYNECDLDKKTKCMACALEVEQLSDDEIEDNFDAALSLAKKWSREV
jgi:hypothetical protein